MQRLFNAKLTRRLEWADFSLGGFLNSTCSPNVGGVNYRHVLLQRESNLIDIHLNEGRKMILQQGVFLQESF